MAEIRIYGDAATLAFEHLDTDWNLVSQLSECVGKISPNAAPPSAFVRAIAASFCQLLSFGTYTPPQSGFPFSSRLERNKYLARVNPKIIELLLEDQPQKLVIERGNNCITLPLGHLSGVVITYPLSQRGTKQYRANKLGPHRFRKRHLVSDQSFRLADAVFIGGAIDLHSVQDVLSIPKLDFQRGREPPKLIHTVAKSALQFLPKVCDIVDGRYGPILRTDPEIGPRPAIYTAFSGRGTGEDFARRVGFVPEPRIEAERGDRRYALDFNLLELEATSQQLRRQLLSAWAWFELMADPSGSNGLVQAIKDAIANLELNEATDDGKC